MKKLRCYTASSVLLIFCQVIWCQTAGSGFTFIQEIEVGSASTGGINDLLTGVDLDGDGNGEIIIQTGLSSNGKAVIYEWNGTDSYNEVWSVTLPVSNSASDQMQRLLAVGDSDNDGNLELFVASSTTSSTEARVYCYEMASGALSNTNPSTSPKGPDGSNTYFSANTRIRAIVVGNADGDSYQELYVGNAGNTTSIEVWEATGNDSWTKITLTGAEDDIGDGIIDMTPLTDLDGDGNEDDLAICEQQGKLTVIDFSTLADPIKVSVNNANDTGTDALGKIVTFNLDNSGNLEIIISNNKDDGIYVFEWLSGSSVYDRDKTDTTLIDIGADIYSIGAQDFDADGYGEIYYTYQDDIKYFEFNSITGDFNASSDFSASANLITGMSNSTFVIRPSMNSGNTLLDGDQLRDFVVGTDGNGTSGWGEIFIVESQTTDSSLPVELSIWSVKSEKGTVILTWATESEIENLGFIIHRRWVESPDFTSLPGNSWVQIASYKTHPELRGQGSSTMRANYQFTDNDVLIGKAYQYRLTDVDYNGKEISHAVRTVVVKTEGIHLGNAFPNPFNPVTYFTITVGELAVVHIRVYDINGRLVTTIANEPLYAGEYTYMWNGKTTNGDPVSSGLYFIAMSDGRGNKTIKKALLIR